MNNTRRKAIDEAMDKLSDVEAALNEIAADIEALYDEENEAFENMPEGLQQSERGQQAEAAANALDTAHSGADDMLSLLSEVRGSLEEAQG